MFSDINSFEKDTVEYVIDHYLTYPRFETEDDYLNYIGTIDSESTDKILRYINAPTRLEFLSNIALVQNFEGLDVTPNYSVDDEGKAYQPSQLLRLRFQLRNTKTSISRSEMRKWTFHGRIDTARSELQIS